MRGTSKFSSTQRRATMLAAAVVVATTAAPERMAAQDVRPSLHAQQQAAALTPPEQKSIVAAFRFLNRQMDRFHRTLIVVAPRPEDSAFYPAAMPKREPGDPRGYVRIAPIRNSGGGLELTFPPATGQSDDWAGVIFLSARIAGDRDHPDLDNWGLVPGMDLTRATGIEWNASAADGRPLDVSAFAGGVNRFPHSVAKYPYDDSLDKTPDDPVPPTTLTAQPVTHRIGLKGQKLDAVIGAFGVAMEELQATERSIYIRSVTVDHARLNEPRFLPSFVLPDPGKSGCEMTAPNAAFVYDQAMALFAYLARPNNEDDRMRADLLARALVVAQNSDRRYSDGRLRNGYASGRLLTPCRCTLNDPACQCTRLPGRWSEQGGRWRYFEDEFSAGTDTFVMSWAGLALLRAYAVFHRQDYLAAATNIGTWIRTMKAPQGFYAGVAGLDDDLNSAVGPQVPLQETRTMDNINLVAFFRHLAATTGDASWRQEADHAQAFVEGMWINNDHLASGAAAKGPTALGVQTGYAMMSNGGGNSRQALDWAVGSDGVGGACRGREPDTLDFDCGDHDGSWWEGSAQVVVASRTLQPPRNTTRILTRLRRAQSSGAVPAASACGLTTHFSRLVRSTGHFEHWLIPSNDHVGSTAWYLLAELGINPYR
jgi:hypothetical protein